MKAAPRNVIGL